MSIADLRGAIARGFNNANLVRREPDAKSLMIRDDMKALLAEMERPAAKPTNAQPAKPVAARPAPAPSPLDRAGRLEEDRLLGELTISLLEDSTGNSSQTQARLEAVLARIESQRKSGPDSPALRASARSIRLKIAEKLWRSGELAEAKLIWDEVLAPRRKVRSNGADPPSVSASLATTTQRITDLFLERGLWEQAAVYDEQSRAGNPKDRIYRGFGSGVLALARGDVAAYRAIAAEGIDRLPENTSFWEREAVRTATLSPESPISPDKLVSMARRLTADDKNDFWRRVTLGNALFRAGRDKEALAAIETDTY